jgi:hypothetical protein
LTYEFNIWGYCLTKFWQAFGNVFVWILSISDSPGVNEKAFTITGFAGQY